MTSGFQLHGYPEPLQSGTGDAAMIGGRGRTEVRNAGRRGRSGGGDILKLGVGASWQNLFPLGTAGLGWPSQDSGSCSRSDVSIWLSSALSSSLP